MMPSQSAIYPLQPWHQKLLRQPVSLPPHNPRPILGQTQVPSTTKYSDCKGRWTGPSGWLLTTRATVDTHCRKQVSDSETAFHQTKAQTAKAVKEARAYCATTIWDAEATCTAAIREVQTTCAECTHILQQSHREHMQEIEREAIEEEGGLPVFSNCLQSGTTGLSPRSMWDTHLPSTITGGEHVFGCSLGHVPPAVHHNGRTCSCNSCPTVSVTLVPKWWCCSSGEEATRPATPTKEPTHQKWKEGKFLMGSKENCWEAFCWDTDLDQATRQMYFETHHPTFDQEGSHDLSSLFWEMITSTDLLESEIYEIQEVWTRWKHLRYANFALRSWHKSLCFFHLVSPSESPKVMGLKGIHHPNALCHHAGLSYCPWCRKEGQNVGTVVNH